MDYEENINHLPSSSGNEKTLLWSQPYIDSGYNTSAPSIRSIDGFLNDENLINNKGDVTVEPLQQDNNNFEAAINAIPELIKLLNDDDEVIVVEAAKLVSDISKNKDTCLILINTANCINGLINSLANNGNLDIAKHVASTFHNMSLHPQGVMNIANSDAVQVLVNLMSMPIEVIVSYSITTIHNLLLAFADIKTKLRSIGVIHKMVPLMHSFKNPKFLTIIVDCLQLLSHGHQESKILLMKLNCPQLLINLLNSSDYQKLKLMSIRLLKVLSVCPENKKILINCGVMQTLLPFLDSTNQNELQNCLIVLRNLSDAATKINGLDSLIEKLMMIISTNDNFGTLAAGALSNLTCNNEYNKIVVIKLNCIPLVVNTIHKLYNNTEMVDSCICILRHLTNNNSMAIDAQKQIIDYHGFNLFTYFLNKKPYEWNIIKAILGVIRNYAENSFFTQFLQNYKIIEMVVQLFGDSFCQYSSGNSNLIDIIELSLNILNVFAINDYDNKIYLKTFNLSSILFQLVNFQNIKIRTLVHEFLRLMQSN